MLRRIMQQRPPAHRSNARVIVVVLSFFAAGGCSGDADAGSLAAIRASQRADNNMRACPPRAFILARARRCTPVVSPPAAGAVQSPGVRQLVQGM
jgi:hypothetical protein